MNFLFIFITLMENQENKKIESNQEEKKEEEKKEEDKKEEDKKKEDKKEEDKKEEKEKKEEEQNKEKDKKIEEKKVEDNKVDENKEEDKKIEIQKEEDKKEEIKTEENKIEKEDKKDEEKNKEIKKEEDKKVEIKTEENKTEKDEEKIEEIKKEEDKKENQITKLDEEKINEMLKLEEEERKYEDKSIKKGKNFNLDDYITMMLIGSGNFSEIYMVEHKTTKILYSMKTFQKMRVEQLHKEIDVLMEKHVMEKIKPHKNIIGYFGSAKDDFQMYILYEYINGGDLWKRVVIYGMPCEKRAKYYFIQILNAIKHMHSFNIPHRDIKPENILVTKNEKLIKIIDFGSSCDLDGTEFEKKFEEIRKKEKNKKPSYKHFVGTPNFMAPECVHNQFSDKRSDYWSLGCVLYNILTGFPPFLGASEYLIFQKSIEAKFIFPKGILSEDAEDLIKKCIVIDPDKRLNIDQMLNHPYLKNEYEDKNFMENLPEMNKDEEEFYNVRKSLLKKYEKFKQHSNDLDSIKKNEDMEEDLRRNDIKPEPTENDKIMKELTSRKDIIKKEYDEALENCIKDLHSFRKEDNDENYKFNCKLDFLETQIKHDIFNIIYRGYEGKPIELNDDSSDDEKKK